MCDAAPLCMGHVSRHKRRDLSKYETVYEDPAFHELVGTATREDRRTTRALAGGGIVESICGLAAVALTVLGLSHRPVEMGALATIAIGIALVGQGASVVSRWRYAQHRLKYTPEARRELFEGVTTELFGGAAGIVLGVLVLALQAEVLLPIAAVVFGVSLLLGGLMEPDVLYLDAEPPHRRPARAVRAVDFAGSLMVLVGIASAVLGVLALVEAGPPISLALVAMLCIGFALVLAGGSLTARFVRRFT